MNTPIADFVRDYEEQNMTRLHMPGHKGQAFVGCEAYDITEVAGADSLYEAEGIIAESLSMDYLETTMFSRVISFMLYVDGNWGKPQENTMGIKQEIYAGLCKELG